MKEPEEITGLPAFAQGVIDGMRQATRLKWYEAAQIFMARAAVNQSVSQSCSEAGFTDAAHHFAACAVYYLAEGLRCLGMSQK